jgi:hypothetical protein
VARPEKPMPQTGQFATLAVAIMVQGTARA